jgi:galactokinase
VAAAKTGGARDSYNRLSLAAEAILERWRRATLRTDASLEAAVTSSGDAPQRVREILSLPGADAFTSHDLINRLDHFLQESLEVIPAAASALAAGDLARFGEWVDRSQLGAERWLGNQVPETIALQRSARELGAVAASAFGAGFGGSVWALADEATGKEFAERWRARYRSAFPNRAGRARFIVTTAGPAARSVTRRSALLPD